MTGGAGAQTTTLNGNRAAREAELSPSGRWVGAALPRKEDRRMLTGRGRFTGDYTRPGMLHAAFARSPFAAAAVGSIDAAAAIDPPSDGHASGDYRKRLAATLVTRALTQSAMGATGA